MAWRVSRALVGLGVFAAGCSSAADVTAPGHVTGTLPQILDNGGPKLTSPRIVTVTWSSDPNAATMQDFDAKIGASQYWSEVTAPYGVGAAHSVNLVLTTPPPSPWDDTVAIGTTPSVDDWVKQNAHSSSSGWPAPDGQTVYVVFVPESVTLTSNGKPACAEYAGYHTDVGGSPDVAYALVPEACWKGTGFSLVDNATSSAAHEIVESATDPFYNNVTPLGVVGFDPQHLDWELWSEWQDEVADACEYFPYAYYVERTDLPYMVQRIWSNADAKAGHDPCAPRLSQAYFDVEPLDLSSVDVDAVSFDGVTVQSYTNALGWRIAPGSTLDVSVKLVSDGSAGQWSVAATEGDCCTAPSGLLTISPAEFTGAAGDVVQLRVTVNAAPPASQGNAIAMSFTSTQQSIMHVRPILIAVY